MPESRKITIFLRTIDETLNGRMAFEKDLNYRKEESVNIKDLSIQREEPR